MSEHEVTNCGKWGGSYVDAIGEMAVRDAVLCPWFDTMGSAAFATILLFGIVFIPMYVRQGSAVMPLILVLIIGGVMFSTMVAMGQSLMFLVVGLGITLIIVWFIMGVSR